LLEDERGIKITLWATAVETPEGFYPEIPPTI